MPNSLLAPYSCILSNPKSRTNELCSAICANINETFKWTILQAFFKHLSVPFPSSTTYSEIVHKYCNKAIWGTWLINQTLNLDNLMVSKSDIIWLSLCPLVDVELPILVPSLTCLLSCLLIYKSLVKISVSEYV